MEVVGRYRMTLRPGPAPDRERLVAAVGIAEQAGAALAGRWAAVGTDPAEAPTAGSLGAPPSERLVGAGEASV